MSEDASRRRSGHGAFVGRERELAELIAGLDVARAGRGRLFLVTGEPGIGKSRLVEEVAGHAASRGFLVLRARCWDGDGTPAYWSFIQLIRAALGSADGDALLKRLGAECAPHLMQDVAQLIPELQPSIVASVRPSAHSSQDVEQARFRLFESIATMFKVLAGLRPLMLVVEDLHDADQPSLVMLRFVVRQLKNAPLMVVGNYRDAEVQRSPILSQLLGDLVREGAPVPLLGLNREGAAQMIEERAAAPCSPKLISDIHQATAGNPLFIDGLVRVLAADGTLSSTNRLDLAAFRVPDGVREAIRRWLGVLSDRSSLVIAATIGQQFELRCLQRVTQLPNHHLLDALREARAAAVVTPVSPGRYRFTHALIRNALCDELNSADRAEVHLKIGKAIEELYRVDVEVHTAALAHHFREGGESQKAVDYSIRAGEAANAVFAYEQAITHWQAALELMPDGRRDWERRADLLERTAHLLGLTAPEGAEQFKYLRWALRIYEELERPEAAARVKAHLTGWLAMRGYTADVSRALEHDERSATLHPQNPDSATSLVWRYIAEAAAAGEGADTKQLLAASRRAMEVSEHLADEVLWARAATSHANGLFASGRVREAFSLIRRAADVANRLNDTLGRTGVIMVCCSLQRSLCDPSKAAARLKRELADPQMTEAFLLRGMLIDGLRSLEVIGGNLSNANRLGAQGHSDPLVGAQIAFYQGEWERADSILARAFDQACQGERRMRACRFSDWLARVRRALGQHAAAEAILRKNLAVCVEGPHIALELHTRQELASIYAETGRPAQAYTQVLRCREVLAAGEDWRGLVGHIRRAEAAVAAAEARFKVADQQFASAVEIFRRYRVPFEEAETLHYWGRALIAAGGGGGGLALEKLDAATELYQRHGAGERWLQRVQADRLRAQSAGTSVEGEPLATRVGKLGLPVGGRVGERVEDATAEGVFRKAGDYWTISWAGSRLRLKDRKGLRYIAHLLRHAGQELAVQELVSAIEHGGNGSLHSRTSASEPNYEHTIARDLGDAGAGLDATAKAQYKHRLEDLREELELAERGNDLSQAARSRYEIEFISEQIAGSLGLHGRDRKSASHAERARLAATKSIRSALNLIREADAELARHLALNIKTGYFCAYVPHSPVNWRL